MTTGLVDAVLEGNPIRLNQRNNYERLTSMCSVSSLQVVLKTIEIRKNWKFLKYGRSYKHKLSYCQLVFNASSKIVAKTKGHS